MVKAERMNFVKTISSGNTATQYESVEDSKDLRIPVQSEEAFEHGINFKCKVSIMAIQKKSLKNNLFLRDLDWLYTGLIRLYTSLFK